jgi:RHS repeat-associated protein
MYWYHPDLLASRATLARSAARFANVMREFGHVEYITDRDGLPLALSGVEVYQYFWYSPWGETLHEQKASSPNGWGTPYQFNGKELDEETGLYYYGARYYNPMVSVWLGACPERLCRFGMDPLALKYPNSSPYVFVANNPINLIDPDGMKWVNAHDEEVLMAQANYDSKKTWLGKLFERKPKSSNQSSIKGGECTFRA